MLKSIIFEKIE